MAFGQAWQITVKSLKAVYEYIGIVMLTNVVWFIVGSFPLLLATLFNVGNPALYFGALALTPLFLGPATAGAHHIIYRLAKREETGIGEFKVGFRKFFGRSAALLYINIVLFAILIVDLLFSLNSTNTFFRLLSGVWLWFILFWLVLIQYIFPILVQQEASIVTVMKRASLVAIDNVIISLLITVVNGIFLALSVVLAAPLLLFFVGLTGFVQNFALVELMKKYEKADADQ